MQPAVCCGAVLCAGPRRASLKGGLEWPLHGQPGRHSGSHGAFCLPVQSGHLISPIHPSLPALPACPCACCSLSRYNRARPWWLLLREQRESHLDRRDWREAGGGQRGGQQQTRCVLVQAKDSLHQSYTFYLDAVFFDFQDAFQIDKVIVCVPGRAFNDHKTCPVTLRLLGGIWTALFQPNEVMNAGWLLYAAYITFFVRVTALKLNGVVK